MSCCVKACLLFTMVQDDMFSSATTNHPRDERRQGLVPLDALVTKGGDEICQA